MGHELAPIGELRERYARQRIDKSEDEQSQQIRWVDSEKPADVKCFQIRLPRLAIGQVDTKPADHKENREGRPTDMERKKSDKQKQIVEIGLSRRNRGQKSPRIVHTLGQPVRQEKLTMPEKHQHDGEPPDRKSVV